MSDDLTKLQLQNDYNHNRLMIKEYNKGNPIVTDQRALELDQNMRDIKSTFKEEFNVNVPLLSPIRPPKYKK